MILLLLFSISSTIRASNAQKPKNTLCACADFFNGAQAIRNAAETYNIFFADFLVFGHRWRVGLMKSKIVKVKKFYNYLAHHLPAITEFSFFWATRP